MADALVYNAVTNQAKQAYDSFNDMYKIESMQKKFRDSFPGTVLDATKWDIVTGTGASTSLATGLLTINSGTTSGSDTYILSKDTFTIPFKLTVAIGMSQRIANNVLVVEVVSVDPTTKNPDGKAGASLIFDGTTATTAKYRVMNGSISPTDISTGFPTTALTSGSPVNYYEIEPFGDECWFHGAALDSTNGRVNSYRRHQMIPDPNGLYKIKIRMYNGTTTVASNGVAPTFTAAAPASTTSAVVQFVACQDYAELTAEITSGRGNAVAGQGIYATVGGTVSLSGTSAMNLGQIGGTTTVNGGVSGLLGVGGAAAHDAAISGNPIRLAGRALTANYATVSTGDTADLVTTLVGALIQKPFAIPEQDWTFACAAPLTAAGQTALKAAGAAGIRNYITGFQFTNTTATATEIQIQDGSTVIWRFYAPASMNMPIFVDFPTPLRTTAATALNVNVVTAGCSLYVNAQGYQAP